MIITDLKPDNEKHIRQAAELLLNCFDGSWETLECAIDEVMDSFDEKKISRVAVDDENNVIGWIGGNEQYDGNVWELHPLAVDERWQKNGIGTLLVKDFEERVRERGGITILLETDDEDCRTTLGGIDLYSDFFENLKNIKNVGQHPCHTLRIFTLYAYGWSRNDPGYAKIKSYNLLSEKVWI
ncbi:MAG: GNAT family N-acetyltransferase [Halanaerobiales bacterium]|nr:GNAT family N-acetyltransferase [Halanaerobiales bacterium]